jgi:hypothetical protein
MENGFNTVPELIDALGGTTLFARLLGSKISTASEMKRRGTIHVRYWPALIKSEKARALGLTAELLMELHARGAAQSVASAE